MLGSERLNIDMSRRFQGYRTARGEELTILKLDKSGGCVDRDEECVTLNIYSSVSENGTNFDYRFQKQTREAVIKEYFFGDAKRTLSPQTQQVNFNELSIYKIREGNNPNLFSFLLLNHVDNQPAGTTNASFLPGIGEEELSYLGDLYSKVTPSQEMAHCIFAIVYAGTHDSQDTIRDAPVMGFVYVADVDIAREKVSILAPMNSKVTDRPMIWGSWPEATMSLMG